MEFKVLVGDQLFEKEGLASQIADDLSIFLASTFAMYKLDPTQQRLVMMEATQQFARAKQSHELLKRIQARVKNGWKPGDPTRDEPDQPTAA